jgi:hypothetical protein
MQPGVSRRPGSDCRDVIIVAAGFCCSGPSTTDYSTNFANYWTIDFAANYSAAFRRSVSAVAEQSLPAMFAIACAHPQPDPVQVRERAELWVGSTAGSASCQDASKAVTAGSLADSDLARAESKD